MIENVAFTPRPWIVCLICGARVAGVEVDNHTVRFALCWPCCQFIGRVMAREAVTPTRADMMVAGPEETRDEVAAAVRAGLKPGIAEELFGAPPCCCPFPRSTCPKFCMNQCPACEAAR
jgi:hypothetical protein